MGQIDIRLNGRGYAINCADGQETHVARLGGYVDRKIGELVKSKDQVVDVKLLLLATLLIADELAETEARLRSVLADGEGADEPPRGDALLVSKIDILARRIEAIAAELEED